MKWCECEACRHDWLRRVVRDLTAIPPWGHDVLIRLAALEGNVADFSGLDQAINDWKSVDDQIISKLDELLGQAGASNSQGDQAQVAAKVVEAQQHIADLRAALSKSEGGAHEAPAPTSTPADSGTPAPAPAAGDGAVPPAAPAASDPSAPGSAPQPPAAAGDPSTTPANSNPAASAPATSDSSSAPQPASGGDSVNPAPPVTP